MVNSSTLSLNSPHISERLSWSKPQSGGSGPQDMQGSSPSGKQSFPSSPFTGLLRPGCGVVDCFAGCCKKLEECSTERSSWSIVLRADGVNIFSYLSDAALSVKTIVL